MNLDILSVLAGNVLLMAVGIFYSIIFHEMAHGYAALWCGDETAKNANRLSLNPIKHIDPLGTVVLPVILALTGMPIFGWAKPVPINLKNMTREHSLTYVSLAGVAVNLALVFVFTFFFALLAQSPAYAADAVQFTPVLQSSVFPSPTAVMNIAGINTALFVFNLLPFPPLDGYNFVVSISKGKFTQFLLKHRQILMIAFIILLGTGLLRYIYVPLMVGIQSLTLNLFL